jgi:phosphoribosylaminoimidazole carboxylase PurE protein
MAKPVVGILMGSDSDLPVMQEAVAMLQEFGIEYEMTIASAHRTPKKVLEYSSSAEKRGLKVIIAGAGWAAHLAGVVASQTTLPVIGVPIDSSALKGIDALLSTVQMPGGVPVATMSLGKAGAKNAGIFAAQILASMDVKIANRLTVYKVEMEREVEEYTSCIEGGTPCDRKYDDHPGWSNGLTDGAYKEMHFELKYRIWDHCQGKWEGSSATGTLEIKGDRVPRFVSYK